MMDDPLLHAQVIRLQQKLSEVHSRVHDGVHTKEVLTDPKILELLQEIKAMPPPFTGPSLNEIEKLLQSFFPVEVTVPDYSRLLYGVVFLSGISVILQVVQLLK